MILRIKCVSNIINTYNVITYNNMGIAAKYYIITYYIIAITLLKLFSNEQKIKT